MEMILILIPDLWQWISITINIILAYIWNPMFFVWGLITSFAIAYAHYYSDKMFG